MQKNYMEKAKKIIVIISETLTPLHGMGVFLTGFINVTIKKFNYKPIIIGPKEKYIGRIKDLFLNNELELIQLPSINTSFLGQPDFNLPLPFSLRHKIPKITKYIYINGFPGLLSLYSLYLGKKMGKKIIFHYHVYLPKFIECIPLLGKLNLSKKLIICLTRFFCNKCDLIITPTDIIKKELIKWGVKETLIKVVPTGVNDFFLKIPNQKELDDLRKNYNKPILLYVGRLSQEKNLKLLIFVIKNIINEFPTINLLIIGKGPDEKKLKKLVNKIFLNNNIKFLGYQNWNSLIKYYWISDIFCMPSLGETQGLSVLEAKACKRPCVVLDKLGLKEQVKNNIDGILVPESETFKETVINFSNAIKKLLKDKELANIIGKNARNNSTRWTIEDSTEYIINLFKEI